MYQPTKNYSIPLILSLIYSQFLSPDANGDTHFDHVHTNVFPLTFDFMNLYQKAKNLASLPFCYRDLLDSKNPTVWLVKSILVQEPDFSQILDLCKNTINNINFRYRTNSKKIKDKFLNKFKKPYFSPIFSIFWAKRFCSKNLAVTHNTTYASNTKLSSRKKLMNQN